MRKILIIILIVITVQAVYSETQIYTSHGKYNNYYHIEFELTKNNFTLSKKSIRSNGQFEVLIPKAFFPIKAPNCKKNIILRMPDTFATKGEEAYQERISLFDKIQEVKTGNIKSLKVVIELNPYIERLNIQPLEIQLQYCNVFFRTAFDHYINHNKPL